MNRRGIDTRSDGRYLGTKRTVADAKRAGLVLSLQAHRDTDMLLLLIDSQAAKDTALGLCNGKPPRSSIESAFKRLLQERFHIGITGNEQ